MFGLDEDDLAMIQQAQEREARTRERPEEELRPQQQSESLHFADHRQQSSTKMSFTLFPKLQKELQVRVISFVTAVPFEEENYTSTLTHVLPLVSKQFRGYCNNIGVLWQDSLIRLIERVPELWKDGLLKVTGTEAADDDNDDMPPRDLVARAVNQSQSYKALVQQIIAARIWFTGPIFYMPGGYQVGEAMALHFFEPRYRRLIHDVMAEWPPEAKAGEHIQPRNGEMPRFVLVDNNVIQPMTQAFLVQVEHCVIYRDGRADVVLVPIEMLELHRFSALPNSGHLYYGECRRLAAAENEKMEQLNQSLK